MDTQLSLLTYLYARLITDPTLRDAMGGAVRLYLDWAAADAAFPYLVHRIEIATVGDVVSMRKATYFLDIWDEDPSSADLLAIRERIVTLLDVLSFGTTECSNCRMSLEFDRFASAMEKGIWHYTFIWEIRYYRKAEIAGILSR